MFLPLSLALLLSALLPTSAAPGALLKGLLHRRTHQQQLSGPSTTFRPAPHLPLVTAVQPGKWRLVRPKAVRPMALSGGGSPSLAQQKVLKAIKKRWGGNFYGSGSWSMLSGTWQGVGVDDRGMVTSLELPASGIKGPFPPELSKLTALQSLDLEMNSISGTIPAGVFASLKQLQEVFLGDNQLSGPFPWVEVASLPLAFLEIGGNSLSGDVPAVVLGGFTQVQSLVLGGGNQFTGSLPGQFASQALSQLDLSGCRFTGTIPVSLGALPNLVIVDLSGNQLTGSFPKSLSQSQFLVSVSVASNNLSSYLPSTFEYGPSLRSASFAGNFFTGYLPGFPHLDDGCPDTFTVNCFEMRVTIDLSSNYFVGPCELKAPLPSMMGDGNVNVTDVCPYTDAPNNIFVDGNCLVARNGCTPQNQRAASDCGSFCGTNTRGGQCGSKGTCVPSFSSSGPQFGCMCARGYMAAGTRNYQCVKK